MASSRVNSGSKSSLVTVSMSNCSSVDSKRWAISPKRMAPARRALPFKVCKARNRAARGWGCWGWALHSRKAAFRVGSSSWASSSKMGNRSGSTISSTSISSSSSSSSAIARTMAASSSCWACKAWAICSERTGAAAVVAVVSTASGSFSSRTGMSSSKLNCASMASWALGKNPAANWCNKRRISSAAATNTGTCARSPLGSGCKCSNTCSKRRARWDSVAKPTVAELPASEWAQAKTPSGWGCARLACQARRLSDSFCDHSSASVKYTLYRGREICRSPIFLVGASSGSEKARGGASSVSLKPGAASAAGAGAVTSSGGTAGAAAASGSAISAAGGASSRASKACGACSSSEKGKGAASSVSLKTGAASTAGAGAVTSCSGKAGTAAASGSAISATSATSALSGAGRSKLNSKLSSSVGIACCVGSAVGTGSMTGSSGAGSRVSSVWLSAGSGSGSSSSSRLSSVWLSAGAGAGSRVGTGSAAGASGANSSASAWACCAGWMASRWGTGAAAPLAAAKSMSTSCVCKRMASALALKGVACHGASCPLRIACTHWAKPCMAWLAKACMGAGMGFCSANQALSICSMAQAASPNSSSCTMRELPLRV